MAAPNWVRRRDFPVPDTAFLKNAQTRPRFPFANDGLDHLLKLRSTAHGDWRAPFPSFSFLHKQQSKVQPSAALPEVRSPSPATDHRRIRLTTHTHTHARFPLPQADRPSLRSRIRKEPLSIRTVPGEQTDRQKDNLHYLIQHALLDSVHDRLLDRRIPRFDRGPRRLHPGPSRARLAAQPSAERRGRQAHRPQ